MLEQRMIKEILQLHVSERVVLIETISNSVREDLQSEDRMESNGKNTEQNADGNKLTISQKLRGSIKLDKVPQTKEEVREMIMDYLTEKYS